MKTSEIIVLTIGIISMITVFITILKYPNPTKPQLQVFRVLLALSAACIASVIPGYVNLETKTHLVMSAGGAIAIFILVYVVNPPELFM